MSNFFEQTIRRDPRVSSCRRIDDLGLLEPVFLRMVVEMIRQAKGMGHLLVPYETFRSQERQIALFERGATQIRERGTHHFGLACDLVLLKENRPLWTHDYCFLGDLAEQYGLIWGGDWGRKGVEPVLRDAVHVQRCSLEDQPRLFSGEWYPDAAYRPLRAGQIVSGFCF